MHYLVSSVQISSFQGRLLEATRRAARRGIALVTLLAMLAPAPAFAVGSYNESDDDGAGPSRAASPTSASSSHETVGVGSEDAPDAVVDAPWVRGYLDISGTEFVVRPSPPMPARLQNRVGFSEAARAARIARVTAEQDLLLAALDRFAEMEREAQARGAAEEVLRGEPFRQAIVRSLETAQRHLAIEQMRQELEQNRRILARIVEAQAHRAIEEARAAVERARQGVEAGAAHSADDVNSASQASENALPLDEGAGLVAIDGVVNLPRSAFNVSQLARVLPQMPHLELLELHSWYNRNGPSRQAQASQNEVENFEGVLEVLTELSHPVRVRIKGNILYRTAFKLMENPKAQRLEGFDEILGAGMTGVLHRYALALHGFTDSSNKRALRTPRGRFEWMLARKRQAEEMTRHYFWRDGVVSYLLRQSSSEQPDELQQFFTHEAVAAPELFDFFRAFVQDVTQDRNFSNTLSLLRTPIREDQDTEVLIQEACNAIDWESLRRIEINNWSYPEMQALEEVGSFQLINPLRQMMGDFYHENTTPSQSSASISHSVASEDSVPAGVNPALWGGISSETASEGTEGDDFSADAPLDSLASEVDPDLLAGISSGGARSEASIAPSVPMAAPSAHSASLDQRASPFSADASDDSVHPVDPALFAAVQPAVAGAAGSLPSEVPDESGSDSTGSNTGSAASSGSANSLTGQLLQAHTARNPRNLGSNILDYFAGMQLASLALLETVEVVQEEVVEDEASASASPARSVASAAPFGEAEVRAPSIGNAPSVEGESAGARSVVSDVEPANAEADAPEAYASSSSRTSSSESEFLARDATGNAEDRTGFKDNLNYSLEGRQSLRRMFPEGGYGRKVLSVVLDATSEIEQLRDLFREGFFPHLETLTLFYTPASLAYNLGVLGEREVSELLAMLHAAPQLQQMNWEVGYFPAFENQLSLRHMLRLLQEAPVAVRVKPSIFKGWTIRVPGFTDSFQRVVASNLAWRNPANRDRQEELLAAYHEEEAEFYGNFGWIDALPRLRADHPTLFREFLEWLSARNLQDQFMAVFNPHEDGDSEEGDFDASSEDSRFQASDQSSEATPSRHTSEAPSHHTSEISEGEALRRLEELAQVGFLPSTTASLASHHTASSNNSSEDDDAGSAATSADDASSTASSDA